eukprot:gnl/TRDRNA2_/TRDRNA2_136814_c0_seq1.p1 gnl/TRDRNA2_/TRDRNA2_136814_c0~~gnl/TRDRNA2_/TRDRNA2_136814_c0_seq1.p1  ORF type:complete len:267 (-),score=49.01 gnl/TRDRNA2_/TRDRNA2_136814_c0_seq1:109-909(-)
MTAAVSMPNSAAEAAKSTAGLLRALRGERISATGGITGVSRVRIADTLASHYLRSVGCDTEGDENVIRLFAMAATMFARRLVAAQAAEEAEPDARAEGERKDDHGSSTVQAPADKGYWIKGKDPSGKDDEFIAQGALSLEHVQDYRGENWVVKFERPVVGQQKKRWNTLWYSCIKHGHENAEYLARRHGPFPSANKTSRGKRCACSTVAETAAADTGDDAAQPPPAKIFRAAPLLVALGAPPSVAAASCPEKRLVSDSIRHRGESV